MFVFVNLNSVYAVARQAEMNCRDDERGSFLSMKTVICDLWENGKTYDLAICRDNNNYVNQTIFNGTTIYSK
jgi:hypothetical protein